MKLKEYFTPPKEFLDKLSYKGQKQVSVLITGNIICVLMFLFFAVGLIVLKKGLTGSLMSLICIVFTIALFVIKKGKMYVGSYITTMGLSLATIIVAFLTSHVSHPVVCYRTICFCIAIANLNYLISLRRGQIILCMGISVVLLFSSTFILHFPEEFMQDPKEWIAAILINMLAIVTANSILLASYKSNDEIVKHSEEAQNEAAHSLATITTVLNQVKESLNVGQKLNDAADTAANNVEAIQNAYKELIAHTEALSSQSESILSSSQIITQKTEEMSSSIMQQNASVEEISTAVTQISANITNINGIAEKRRSGMEEVSSLLNSQNKLVTTIVDNVTKVEESSARIAEFVNTVDKIAQQTNLLAMNASIEAAHSGENGKGFGVIAQEIRKLSEETAINAKNISETLLQNAEVVKETSASVSTFAVANKKTEKEIKETFDSIEEILHGITEIDTGSQEIKISVNKVVDVANDNAKIIDEVVNQISSQNQGINKINNTAESVKDSVTNVSTMLPNISYAMEDVHNSAKENEEVSSRIAELLK